MVKYSFLGKDLLLGIITYLLVQTAYPSRIIQTPQQENKYLESANVKHVTEQHDSTESQGYPFFMPCEWNGEKTSAESFIGSVETRISQLKAEASLDNFLEDTY